MTIELGLTCRVAVACIGIGIFIFALSLALATSMFLSVSPGEGAGLTLVPVLVIFNGYIGLSLCNLVGGLIICFSSRNDRSGLSRAAKIAFSVAAIAQVMPAFFL